MGQESIKAYQESPKDRLKMVSRQTAWAKKVPESRLEMVSRQPIGAKKVPRINKKNDSKTANLGQECVKNRLALKVPRIN